METAHPILDNSQENAIIEKWRHQLEQILQAHAGIPYRYGDVTTYLVVSRDRNHYLLMHEGWETQHRVHGIITHAEIRHGKIWIHYDGIENGITSELVAAGIPKDCIILAFHPPHIRDRTGYGVD